MKKSNAACGITAGECIGIEGMPEDEALDLIAEPNAHAFGPNLSLATNGSSATF